MSSARAGASDRQLQPARAEAGDFLHLGPRRPACERLNDLPVPVLDQARASLIERRKPFDGAAQFVHSVTIPGKVDS